MASDIILRTLTDGQSEQSIHTVLGSIKADPENPKVLHYTESGTLKPACVDCSQYYKTFYGNNVCLLGDGSKTVLGPEPEEKSPEELPLKGMDSSLSDTGHEAEH